MRGWGEGGVDLRILKPDTSPLAKLLPCLLDPLKESRIIFELIIFVLHDNDI